MAAAAAKGIEAVVMGAMGVTPQFSLHDHLGDRAYSVDFAALVARAEAVVGDIVAGTPSQRPS